MCISKRKKDGIDVYSFDINKLGLNELRMRCVSAKERGLRP